MSPHPVIGWDGVSWIFCTGWPWTAILQVSASWVARITDLSHHSWLEIILFYLSIYLFIFINYSNTWCVLGNSKYKERIESPVLPSFLCPPSLSLTRGNGCCLSFLLMMITPTLNNTCLLVLFDSTLSLLKVRNSCVTPQLHKFPSPLSNFVSYVIFTFSRFMFLYHSVIITMSLWVSSLILNFNLTIQYCIMII
jgi:hypothetical protein